jgi:hypothetical protein
LIITATLSSHPCFQNRIIIEGLPDPVLIQKLIQIFWLRTDVIDLLTRSCLEIHLQVRERKASLSTHPNRAPGIQIPKMIVTPNVQDDVFGRMIQLHNPHPPVGLVDAVPTDPVIPDRFLQVRGQILLPRLPVADLVTMCEAIFIRVQAGRSIGKFTTVLAPSDSYE